MNILFINTLRLGDTLMSWHIVKALHQKYANANIDYLTFDNSKPLTPLLQNEANLYFISRGLLQEMNADVDVSIFRSYEELEKELKPILLKKYDLVINYSNTKISTYIASIVHGNEIIGTHFNAQKIINYGSKWIMYLDLKSTNSQGGYFHFNEIFANALELKINEDSSLLESNAGKVEIKKFINSPNKKYILQLFTSDIKKDFPLTMLDSFLVSLSQRLSGEFLLLCMPNSELLQRPLPIENAKWVACGLEGAYSLLQAAEAVISVDTSIKHLASFTSSKIIELCFGSSRPQQTGVYKNASLIVQPKEYCYPCRHSESCYREEVQCSQINEVELADTISCFIENRNINKTDSFITSMTYFDGLHYILQGKEPVRVRENLLTKLSWIYHLSQSLNEEAHSLVHFFIEEIAGLSFERLDQNLIFLQRELEDIFRNLKVGENIKTFVEDPRFVNLQGILKNLNLDFNLPKAEGIIDFAQTRYMQKQLQELLEYLNSYRKLNQNILSEAKYYERASNKHITI